MFRLDITTRPRHSGTQLAANNQKGRQILATSAQMWNE
jgi:hypothetical protein